MKSFNVNQKGFIALVTILILCSMLSAALFTASTRSILQQISALGQENKERSRILADDCVFIAIQNYGMDSTYSPSNQLLTLPTSGTCTINSIVANDNSIWIRTSASYENSYTQMLVTMQNNMSSYIPTSWTEQIPTP